MRSTAFVPELLRNPRHLGTRLSLDLALAAAIGFVAIFLFTSAIVSQRFGALEQREIATNISRLDTLIENQQRTVQTKVLDWSIWTDAFEHVRTGDPGFVESNLDPQSLANLDVSSIAYVRFDRRFSTISFVDLATKESDPESARSLRQYLTSTPVVDQARRREQFQTFVRIGDDLLVLAFSHVRLSDGSGVPLGFAVVSRKVEASAIERQLQQRTSANFFRDPLRSSVEHAGDVAHVAVMVPGLEGKPLATIRFMMRRDVHLAGTALMRMVGLGIGALLLLMVAMLRWRLKKAVVDPLVGIETHIRRVGTTRVLAQLPEDRRRDEIGSLRNGFNEMTGQLIDLRAELDAQSFELGKNQAAIGVIHNMRNGLAPVFTILTRMHEQLHFTGQDNVVRAISELHDRETPAERRDRVSHFLSAALSQYEDQLGTCRSQAREAGRSLAGVIEAIAQVQADDRASPEVEDCNLAEVLAPALASVRHANGVRVAIEVDSEPAAQMVRANRILFSQVVGNLLTNAVESIAATGRISGAIAIRQKTIDTDRGRAVEIAVTDDGEGFDPQVAATLFERGYSTRPGKAGGLGLHWCANTVNAMGGALDLRSSGRGKGATASLRLPAAAQEDRLGLTARLSEIR